MVNQHYDSSLALYGQTETLDPFPLKKPIREKVIDLPPLRVLLDDLGPLPPYAGFMGVCEDGMPIIFNMNENKSGCKLLISDSQTALTKYLDMFVASIRLLSGEGKIQVDRVSDSHGIGHNYHRSSNRHELDTSFVKLVAASDIRYGYSNRPINANPIQVLVIDNLEAYLSTMSIEIYGRFLRLVQEGPNNNVWIIAGINLKSTVSLDDLLIQSFPVKVFGPIHSREYIGYFTRTPPSRIRSLTAGRQYILDSRQNWHTFWIPSR